MPELKLCSHHEKYGHRHNSIPPVFLLQKRYNERLAQIWTPESFWLWMSQLGVVIVSKNSAKKEIPGNHLSLSFTLREELY